MVVHRLLPALGAPRRKSFSTARIRPVERVADRTDPIASVFGPYVLGKTEGCQLAAVGSSNLRTTVVCYQ
jgi:hypothetical protein